MRLRRSSVLVGLLLLPATACSPSDSEFYVEVLDVPVNFEFSLRELSEAAEECDSGLRERFEETVGFQITDGACTQIGRAAAELAASTLERGVDAFDQSLLAENLLSTAREQALQEGRETIIAEDIKFYGIGFFLDLIGFRKSRGFLRVASTPDRSTIHIDRKFVGNTNRRFVLSPGEHRVSVENAQANLLCTMLVDVPEDQELRIHCPKP